MPHFAKTEVIRKWAEENNVPVRDLNLEGLSPFDVLGEHATPFLRDLLMGECEEIEIPDRFLCEREGNDPVKITDIQTGKSTLVPLHGYSTVRQVLSELFAEE